MNIPCPPLATLRAPSIEPRRGSGNRGWAPWLCRAALGFLLCVDSAAAQPTAEPSSPPEPVGAADYAEVEADAIAIVTDRALDIYKPVYFLLNAEDGVEAKFRISIKARLLKHKLGEEGQSLRLYFGYTQTSYWDIGGQSSPFRETDYNPEFFISWRHDNPSPGPGWRFLLMRAGVAHESNGRDGDASRSWNYVFVEPHFVFRPRRRSYDTFQISARIWPLVAEGTENPDLLDTYGYGELVTAARLGRGSVRLAGRLGRDGDRGGLALDLAWRTSHHSSLQILLQGWSGYGENLLDYRVKDTNFRLGLMITR